MTPLISTPIVSIDWPAGIWKGDLKTAYKALLAIGVCNAHESFLEACDAYNRAFAAFRRVNSKAFSRPSKSFVAKMEAARAAKDTAHVIKMTTYAHLQMCRRALE